MKKLRSVLTILIMSVGVLIAMMGVTAFAEGASGSTVTVSTEAELRNALADYGVETIVLGDIINVGGDLNIGRDVLIDFSGMAINIDGDLTAVGGGMVGTSIYVENGNVSLSNCFISAANDGCISVREDEIIGAVTVRNTSFMGGGSIPYITFTRENSAARTSEITFTDCDFRMGRALTVNQHTAGAAPGRVVVNVSGGNYSNTGAPAMALNAFSGDVYLYVNSGTFTVGVEHPFFQGVFACNPEGGKVVVNINGGEYNGHIDSYVNPYSGYDADIASGRLVINNALRGTECLTEFAFGPDTYLIHKQDGLPSYLTGLRKVNGTWYYLYDGEVKGINALAKNEYGWWYIGANGKIDFNYNGVAQNEWGTWYVKNGKLDQSVNGLVKAGNTWYYFVNGKVTGLRALAKNQYGWWYIGANGKIDTSYNGVARNDWGTWYVKNGKLDQTVNGLVKAGNTWYYFVNGKVTGLNALAKNQYGWFYIGSNGQIDFNFTGIAGNDYGQWYVKNGKLDQSYSGTVRYNGHTYTVVKGKVTKVV